MLKVCGWQSWDTSLRFPPNLGGAFFTGGNVPFQNLEIVPRLLPDVRAGKKLHTIRWREREIVPGPMLYVNEQDAFDTVMVCVTYVEKMPLSDVAARLGKVMNGRMLNCWKRCVNTIRP